MDARCREIVDQTVSWRRDAYPDGWGISQALGFYPTKAGEANLRAECGVGEEVAGYGLSAHCHPKAGIHRGDGTGIQTGANRVRGFAPKGEPSVIRMVAKKSHVSMISSITNGGKVRFMMYQNAVNAKLLIRLMTRLIKDADRKVFLILDNLRVHNGKNVKQWLEEHKEQIEVFCLPSYSPELNPDKYLNGNLKNKVHSGKPIRNQEDLEKKTRSFMRTLVKRPVHVSNYFKHPRAAYAA